MESDHTSLLLNCFPPLSCVYQVFPTYPAFTPRGLKYHIRLTIPIFFVTTQVCPELHLGISSYLPGISTTRASSTSCVKTKLWILFRQPQPAGRISWTPWLIGTVGLYGHQNLEQVLTLF